MVPFKSKEIGTEELLLLEEECEVEELIVTEGLTIRTYVP